MAIKFKNTTHRARNLELSEIIDGGGWRMSRIATERLLFLFCLGVMAFINILLVSKLEEDNAKLIERLNEKREIAVSIDVRGDWVYAEAYVDGRPAVEVGRPISDFRLYKKQGEEQ